MTKQWTTSELSHFVCHLVVHWLTYQTDTGKDSNCEGRDLEILQDLFFYSDMYFWLNYISCVITAIISRVISRKRCTAYCIVTEDVFCHCQAQFDLVGLPTMASTLLAMDFCQASRVLLKQTGFKMIQLYLYLPPLVSSRTQEFQNRFLFHADPQTFPDAWFANPHTGSFLAPEKNMYRIQWPKMEINI